MNLYGNNFVIYIQYSNLIPGGMHNFWTFNKAKFHMLFSIQYSVELTHSYRSESTGFALAASKKWEEIVWFSSN